MHFSKSLQGSKSAITMRFVPIELILSLFLLIQNFFKKKDCFSFLDVKISCINKQLVKKRVVYFQFLIFNPWKVPWNWIAFSQNSFFTSPGLLWHLMRRDSVRLAHEAFTSNPIVNGLKIKKCFGLFESFLHF